MWLAQKINFNINLNDSEHFNSIVDNSEIGIQIKFKLARKKRGHHVFETTQKSVLIIHPGENNYPPNRGRNRNEGKISSLSIQLEGLGPGSNSITV